MTPRSINLRGLSPAETETKVREFVADIQQESLADYEIALIDHGYDRDDIAAELARRRAELVDWREQAIERMRAMAERGGSNLH
jgi:hypothetical protein